MSFKARYEDIDAQRDLGIRYLTGNGIARSFKDARYWLTKAAAKNDPEAQYWLASMYELGKGVSISIDNAIRLYEKAANQGHAGAASQLQKMKKTINTTNTAVSSQFFSKKANTDEDDDESAQLPDNYTMAVQYYNNKDYSQAQYLFRGEALKGDARAQFYLGEMYCNGDGVTKSITVAYTWYMKSARSGNADAQNRLGWMYRKGIGVDQSDREAFNWYKLSAKQGHYDSQARLGWFYESGRGVGKSYSEAAKWYLKSARQGDEFAQSRLGVLYENGMGVTQSINDALYWYQKAAEQGNAFAITNLNKLKLVSGDYQADNYEFKQTWKAAVKGDPASQTKLGIMYLNGTGVGVSYLDAAKWLDRAASAGNAEAQAKLAWMYLNGCGVTIDLPYAISLYEKAALSDNQEAIDALSKLKKKQTTRSEPSKTKSAKKLSSQIKQNSTTPVANFDLIFNQVRLNELLSNPERFISFVKDLKLPISMIIILESCIRYAPDSLKGILQSTDENDFRYRIDKMCSDLRLDLETATVVLQDMQKSYKKFQCI